MIKRANKEFDILIAPGMSRGSRVGIVVSRVTFESPAPTMAVIAARVTERVGLPVIIRESSTEIRETLYELHTDLAFEAYPRCEIEVKAYRIGNIKEDLIANEAEGKQSIDLRGYVGQEPTLLYATTLALESLGGQCSEPISDEIRREFGSVITSDELNRRHRMVQRQALLVMAIFVLSLPILVPFWVITFAWRMITPRRISKSHRLLK